jgi:hypothetical protein
VLNHLLKAALLNLVLVCCCPVQELWALIMDAGTGFTAQTYSLSNQFLPKEWIMVSQGACRPQLARLWVR